jgi:hypothetical protein
MRGKTKVSTFMTSQSHQFIPIFQLIPLSSSFLLTENMLKAIYLLLLAWAYAPVLFALPIEQRGPRIPSLPRAANPSSTLDPVQIYDPPAKNGDSDELGPNEIRQSWPDDFISEEAIQRHYDQSVSGPNERRFIGPAVKLGSKLVSKLKGGGKKPGKKDTGKMSGKKDTGKKDTGRMSGKKKAGWGSSIGIALADGADAMAAAAAKAAEAAAEQTRKAVEAAAEAARKAAEGGSSQAAKPVGG